LIAWITRHAEQTSTSILADQQAKEYMPTWFAMADNDDEPPVKMSKSGICHERGTTYYSKAKNLHGVQHVRRMLAGWWKKAESIKI
jgi:hypothetical protein